MPALGNAESGHLRYGGRAELRPDSVIVARHPDDGYVCKRVERVGRSKVELASLEPGRPPIVIPRDSSLVLGTVLLVWCTHRT